MEEEASLRLLREQLEEEHLSTGLHNKYCLSCVKMPFFIYLSKDRVFYVLCSNIFINQIHLYIYNSFKCMRKMWSFWKLDGLTSGPGFPGSPSGPR